ncbi:hypothetical protein KY285_000705 [Solanum tuberosum]|nr:hypothetical protein KY285_000705 [Solanum tuberosum]
MDVPDTLEEEGYAGKLPMTILIDSVSTHSFVDPHIVKLLRLPAQPMQRPMRITVANEQLMSCQLETIFWDPEVTPVDTKALRRMLHCGTCDIVAELSLINDSMDNQEREVLHPGIRKLLQNHAAIFQEPTELPPEKTCDHAINLVSGAQPFNL